MLHEDNGIHFFFSTKWHDNGCKYVITTKSIVTCKLTRTAAVAVARKWRSWLLDQVWGVVSLSLSIYPSSIHPYIYLSTSSMFRRRVLTCIFSQNSQFTSYSTIYWKLFPIDNRSVGLDTTGSGLDLENVLLCDHGTWHPPTNLCESRTHEHNFIHLYFQVEIQFCSQIPPLSSIPRSFS